MPIRKVVSHGGPLLGALLAGSVLAGCDLAPKYQPPTVTPPADSFKEAGSWTPADPADAAPRGHWWAVIPDPQLDALETTLDQQAPSLQAALARYDQAVDLARKARAGLVPEFDANGSVSHQSYPSTPEHDISLGGTASYELDLWGHVRNQVAAARAEAQASAADAAGIKLSLEAQLADDYLNLRGLDAQIDVLRQTTEAFKQALDLTQSRYDGGASSEVDLDRAKTQLGDVQAEYEQTQASRALLEHAIAALIGEQPSRFSLAAQTTQADAPRVPVSAPSELLQRRPDIAAAERRVKEANANVGVARAALYPTVTLSGAGGFETLGEAAHAAAGYWAAGPAFAVLPLFDGGRRHAEVARARSAFDEAAATYRQTVLDAFRQVEDELSLTNRLALAEARQQEAVDAAVATDKLSTQRYTEGAADYLEVVTAQTAELQARQADVAIRTQRLVASIDLVRALGGGWTTTDLPTKLKTVQVAQPQSAAKAGS
jgi:NodT family efflux transporter outer membrane factor (OMF) lipoprotein